MPGETPPSDQLQLLSGFDVKYARERILVINGAAYCSLASCFRSPVPYHRVEGAPVSTEMGALDIQ